ncbi:MAG: HlyD family efflux transporter periplasmic adaptor subunit [Rhodocyclaceae bacterium]|nr:HlyD family efflux transporter periplasmic adaptor subunit [Rhodocyclaceae bacterium]
MANDTPNSVAATAIPSSRRKPLLIGLAALMAASAAGYGAWYTGVGRYRVGTDNAYVQGNVVQVTPQQAGTVLAIYADDTNYVRAGQALVKLDPADAKLALDQAEAQLAQTVREVRTTYANNATLSANIATRQAELVRAQSDAARAQSDLARRQPLLATGAVSKEELHHSTSALEEAHARQAAAQAALAAAREQLASNQSLTEGTPVEGNPRVQRAAVAVREAWLALKRTEIPAPLGGQVARRSVQVGQRVSPGAPLLAIVPLEQVWVDANFKESQLRDLRIGQPVTLRADLYGGRVEYHGRVAGLGAGTGAAFSLLPAQNATGNWIKVVQRVPVRVELDAAELAQHPLRVGLSMDVQVDVHDQSGPALAAIPPSRAVAQTPVFDADNAQADAAVNAIVSANLGRKAVVARLPETSEVAAGNAPVRLAAYR